MKWTAFFIVVLSVFLIGAGNAPSNLTFFNSRSFTFTNKDCAKTATCGLMRFSLKIDDYQIMIGGTPSYGTRLIAEYETDQELFLEEYAIVQFIRGCIFESLRKADGSILNVQNVWRWQFDDAVPFSFVDWVIDSVDKDPVYNSGGKVRHGFYRWNEIPGSYKTSTEHFFQNQPKPKRPALYVIDHPGTAFVTDGEARNVSLKFKTCVYKAADIPVSTTQQNINFASPIACFPWQSSFIYNHDTQAHEGKNAIDPFCNVPVSRSKENESNQ